MDSFAQSSIPRAISIHVTDQGAGAQGALVTVNYSTQGAWYTDSYFQVSYSVGVQVLDVTRGCTWKNVGTKVDLAVSTVIPVTEITVTRMTANAPSGDMSAYTGTVNNAAWTPSVNLIPGVTSFPSGTVRFDGVDGGYASDSYGTVGYITTSFKFSYVSQGWLCAWRTALQKVKDGVPQYWSSDPEAEYVADGVTHMDSDPVYVDGAAGTPGWDYPVDGSGNYRYGLTNFSQMGVFDSY